MKILMLIMMIIITTMMMVKVPRETNSMVEEFMLAANISAATKIFEVKPGNNS